MQKQLIILEKEVAKFRQDSTIDAVLLTGSVAYGMATMMSDIDIVIICDRDNFESEYVEGILVEKHFHKYDTLDDALSKNAVEVYKYLYSKVLFDNTDKLSALIRKAREIYSTYSATKREYQNICCWLSATKIKLLSSMDSKEEKRMSFLLSTNTWKVLEGVWIKNNKPMPPSSLAYAKHNELAKEPWNGWFDDLIVGNTESRVNVMLKIIDWICDDYSFDLS